MKNNFVGLIILDGLGIAKKSNTNAVSLAKMPNLDDLLKHYPNTTLEASELAVGLPEGQMGNSEVGHLNLGAGRVVYQSLTRLNKSIQDGDFFSNQAFLNAIEHVKKNHSKLHVLGLLGTGGVHASTNHLIALNTLAKNHGLNANFHIFTDGRDTPQESAYAFMQTILNENLHIATLSGRYYAMDRDNNWDRVQKAYDNLTKASGKHESDVLKGIKDSYENGITDEFIIPFVVDKHAMIEDHDAVIFANFRPDRAIRIATAISNPSQANFFHSDGKAFFHTDHPLKDIYFISMMHYHEKVKGEIAYPLQKMDNLYGDVIANHNLKQLRIAETEKYPHVTFFFDGGIDKSLEGATRILVESPKVPTYDLMPEMSAYGVKEKAVEAILSKQYQTMILNFANPDMVGHTGSISATVKACEAVDENLGDVLDAINKIGGIAIVLADHGNAEVMVDENGNPHTAHTTNLVPCIITKRGLNLHTGALCDVAPTMLDLLGLEKPLEMTGKSLIIKS